MMYAKNWFMVLIVAITLVIAVVGEADAQYAGGYSGVSGYSSCEDVWKEVQVRLAVEAGVTLLKVVGHWLTGTPNQKADSNGANLGFHLIDSAAFLKMAQNKVDTALGRGDSRLLQIATAWKAALPNYFRTGDGENLNRIDDMYHRRYEELTAKPDPGTGDSE